MLEIANLEVVYNEVILVLRGLSIEVRDGQIVALLGANGAGKTTVTRAVTGLLDVHEGKITKGSVPLEGRRIAGDDHALPPLRAAPSSPPARQGADCPHRLVGVTIYYVLFH